MPEVRFIIDEKLFDALKKETGIDKPSQLTNEALNLLKWAASEVKQGRVLMTANAQGGDIHKIVIPSLENARDK